MSELWKHGAAALAGMIARRQVSSAEVVEAHLARIAAVNPALNAVVAVHAESARAAAGDADRAVAAGAALGPLHGVPFTVKANIDLVGQATTHGVPALANAFPGLDDPTVERMKGAGAIPIASTNLPDMGLRLHTDSGLYGLTRNPWSRDVTVGGSSGGEGAALASGMSPIGLGNDIGGSLRNPAFACGIASLKPGFGRIPLAAFNEPRSPSLSAQLMAVFGPMAREVADLKLALSILAGPHPRDPWSFPAPLTGPAPAQPIRVAVVADPPGGTTDPAIAASVRAAAAALTGAGYAVEEVDPPMVEEAIDIWGSWLSWELSTNAGALTAIMSPDAGLFFQRFVARWPVGSYADSVMLQVRRHQVARAWSEFFARYPLILGPTWCQPQFVHGFDVAEDASTDAILNLMRFVVPMNLLGLPVACVPVGLSAAGLPLGVQLIADRFREDLALDAAAAVEAALGRLTPIDPR